MLVFHVEPSARFELTQAKPNVSASHLGTICCYESLVSTTKGTLGDVQRQGNAQMWDTMQTKYKAPAGLSLPG